MLNSKQLLKCCLQVKDSTTKCFVDGGIQTYPGCRPFRRTTYTVFPAQMTRRLSSRHINTFFSSFLVIHSKESGTREAASTKQHGSSAEDGGDWRLMSLPWHLGAPKGSTWEERPSASTSYPSGPAVSVPWKAR